MAEVKIDQSVIASVKGKVVVLVGGALGIGAATITILYNSGAHVYFGDWDEKASAALVDRLTKSSNSAGGSIAFLKCNAADYQSILAVFDLAFNKHKQIDHAINCAGITENVDIWSPDKLNLETVRQTATNIPHVMDINLNGSLYFSRIALAYLRENHSIDPEKSGQFTIESPKSITIVSSVAGITEAPGVITYSATKHGIIGLVRSLRAFAAPAYGVRINAICPWSTDTRMLGPITDPWLKANLPINTADEVASYIIQVAAEPHTNGTALFVGGGKAVDVEEGLKKAEPIWLGEEFTREFKRGQAFFGEGDVWHGKKK